jgi:hypothetical protein
MADIPVHQLTFQVYDAGGGDPASGGGDSGMGSVLETLKQIQVNVGAINGNVRAILDTLRRIATGGRSLGGEAGIGSRGGRGAGVGVERVFHVDPRKAIVPYSPYASPSYASEGPFSPLRAQAEHMRAMGRIRRGLLLPPSAAEANRPKVPTPFGFETPEGIRQSGYGFFSLQSSGFGGISGIMGEGKNAMRIPSKYDLETGKFIPGSDKVMLPKPIPEKSERPVSQQGAIMALVSGVGKVIATISMIGTAIRTIVSFVRYVPSLAVEMRERMGNVSVPMAQMNMNVRMAEIMDQMKIANNRGVVSSFANMSKAQIEFITMSRPLRTAFTQAVGNIGAQMYSLGGAAATFMSGLMGFDMQAIIAGFGGMRGYGLPGDSVGKMIYDAYVMQQMAGQRSTFASQFEADLNVMTAGRFSTSSAYTSKAANKRNWWDYRP